MENYIQLIIPAIVAIVSSASGFLIARSNNSKALTINDRLQLSEDEKAFRHELRESIESYKKELTDNRAEITKLREEVAMLHKINLELTLDNKTLQTKVDEMRNEIHKLQLNKNSNEEEIPKEDENAL